MMYQSFILTSVLAVLGQCASTVLEAVPVKPRGWTRVADAPPDGVLKLRIALAQPNEALFERVLHDVSDPAHAKYGQHLSRDELSALMAPRVESISAVRYWLRDAGISDSDVDEDGDWIKVKLTVREASELLEAEFGVWSYEGTKAEKVRALKYSVPEELVEHIRFVGNVVRFGQIRPQRSQILEVVDSPQPELKTAAAIPPQNLDVVACNASITPECLRALYKVGSYQADPTKKSLFGVSGFLEQWAKHDQLEPFVQKYAPYAADNNFTAVGVNGGVNIEGPTEENDVEANLDIQYAVALGYKTPITYYSTGGRGPLVPDLEQAPIHWRSREISC